MPATHTQDAARLSPSSPLHRRGLAVVLAAMLTTLAAPARAQPAGPPPAAAPIDSLLPAIVMTNAAARPGLDLSGTWVLSRDRYRVGLADIHDSPPEPRNQRYRDIDVAAQEAAQPNGFFEFDMQRGPRVELPGAWNLPQTEMRFYDGLVWYQRQFTPPARAGRRAFLRFEAVNYKAVVYLNGQRVGAHEGGFTPFTFEVTALLRAGPNQITVGVDSTRDAQSLPPVFTDWELYGGITRPVRLVYTPATYIDDAHIHLTGDQQLRATVRLDGPAAAHQAVSLRISALGLQMQGRTDASGTAQLQIAAPPGLQRWTPDAPHLYTVALQAGDDRLEDRVGLRTVQVVGEDILLNGVPIVLRGISLHEEEFGPTPARIITPQAARALLSEIKHGLNGNYVRLSHYPHSEVTLRLADEIGLLVWSEIPVYWSVDFKSPQALLTARRMQAESILRDRNRAALIIWGVGNETPGGEHRLRFHSQLADDARALDPSRLVSAALWADKRPVGGRLEATIRDPLADKLDILAINTYTGWYGDNTLDEIAGTHWHNVHGKPLLLSEFGADAKAGFHDPLRRRKFSEEFQADFYTQTLAMADRIPFLRGLSPWILKDFQSPRREHPVYQNGWNRKGLVSETGARKLAFDVLARHYQRLAQAAAAAAAQPALAAASAKP